MARSPCSTIAAGNTVNLAADNAITLEGSKNTFDSAGKNKSSGASVGVGYAMGSQNDISYDMQVPTEPPPYPFT